MPNPVGSDARALGKGSAFIGVADDTTTVTVRETMSLIDPVNLEQWRQDGHTCRSLSLQVEASGMVAMRGALC